MAKLSDLTEINELTTALNSLKDLRTRVVDGEQLTLKIGDDEIAVTSPDMVESARYQLTVYFDTQIETVENQLKALDLTID